MSHNPHAFWLGYKPTVADWQRKGEELRGRIKAKRTGKQYELVHKPIRGTLNGRFICQGEDFPFCGFLEPWYGWETNTRYLGFEIFFGKQLLEEEDEQVDLSIGTDQ